MAIKGTASKAILQKQILDAFPGSFLYNDGKEIRVTMQEDGADVQIKITLTAAKTAVSHDGEVFAEKPAQEENIEFAELSSTVSAQPTKEETENVLKMAEFLKRF